MSLAARVGIGLLAIVLYGSGLKAQSCGTFDVASVKVNTSGGKNSYPELAPGGRRLIATNQYMVALICSPGISPLQMSAIPSAVAQAKYDIEATCEQPMTKEQLPHMIQMLLADRFHLAIHRELKEQRVYFLVPGKGGPKLHKPSNEGGNPDLRQSGHSFTFT
jgi:uncharacterized protein (TIGR03435 family)